MCVFSLLLCCFDCNHVNGSLDPRTYSVRKKSRKRFNFRQLLTDYFRDEACKNTVYNVCFCVTLFQNLFSFFNGSFP